MNMAVIGGIAAGPNATAKVSQLRPDADVTMIEKGEFLSHAGCGFPYYVSGMVKEQAQLMSTAICAVRGAKSLISTSDGISRPWRNSRPSSRTFRWNRFECGLQYRGISR